MMKVYHGESNADDPLQVNWKVPVTFRVEMDDFGLYTVGEITGRQYFGRIRRGVNQAYEVQHADGQKSVILQRLY